MWGGDELKLNLSFIFNFFQVTKKKKDSSLVVWKFIFLDQGEVVNFTLEI